MLKIKSSVEWSDKGYTYWNPDTPISDVIGDEKYVMLYGDDVVRAIFGQPLENVVGCTIEINGVTYRANYLYSSTMKRDGRIKAFKIIEDSFSLAIFFPCPLLLLNATDLGHRVAFDIETGGSSQIRCISFYDGSKSFYVDCRGLKSDKALRKLLVEVFTSDREWIAHYGIHDISVLCKVLKIPPFKLWKDTIWFERDVEFRSLRYLSGVYLGVPVYKNELAIANETMDFNRLVNYCCKDSVYTWYLSEKLKLLPMTTLNQVYYTMLNTKLDSGNELFEKYPELKGLSKAELRKAITKIDATDLQLLKDTVNPPQPTITVHGLEGLNVKVKTLPDRPYYVKSYANTVMEIMARDIRYNSAEISVYRYRNEIEPMRHYFFTECDEPFLVNHVCCVSIKPIDGWFEATREDLFKLFNGSEL